MASDSTMTEWISHFEVGGLLYKEAVGVFARAATIFLKGALSVDGKGGSLAALASETLGKATKDHFKPTREVWDVFTILQFLKSARWRESFVEHALRCRRAGRQAVDEPATHLATEAERDNLRAQLHASTVTLLCVRNKLEHSRGLSLVALLSSLEEMTSVVSLFVGTTSEATTPTTSSIFSPPSGFPSSFSSSSTTTTTTSSSSSSANNSTYSSTSSLATGTATAVLELTRIASQLRLLLLESSPVLFQGPSQPSSPSEESPLSSSSSPPPPTCPSSTFVAGSSPSPSHSPSPSPSSHLLGEGCGGVPRAKLHSRVLSLSPHQYGGLLLERAFAMFVTNVKPLVRECRLHRAVDLEHLSNVSCECSRVVWRHHLRSGDLNKENLQVALTGCVPCRTFMSTCHDVSSLCAHLLKCAICKGSPLGDQLKTIARTRNVFVHQGSTALTSEVLYGTFLAVETVLTKMTSSTPLPVSFSRQWWTQVLSHELQSARVTVVGALCAGHHVPPLEKTLSVSEFLGHVRSQGGKCDGCSSLISPGGKSGKEVNRDFEAVLGALASENAGSYGSSLSVLKGTLIAGLEEGWSASCPPSTVMVVGGVRDDEGGRHTSQEAAGQEHQGHQDDDREEGNADQPWHESFAQGRRLGKPISEVHHGSQSQGASGEPVELLPAPRLRSPFPFVGRDELLASVVDQLAEGGWVGLFGRQGVGKSLLARETLRVFEGASSASGNATSWPCRPQQGETENFSNSQTRHCVRRAVRRGHDGGSSCLGRSSCNSCSGGYDGGRPSATERYQYFKVVNGQSCEALRRDWIGLARSLAAFGFIALPPDSELAKLTQVGLVDRLRGPVVAFFTEPSGPAAQFLILIDDLAPEAAPLVATLFGVPPPTVLGDSTTTTTTTSTRTYSDSDGAAAPSLAPAEGPTEVIVRSLSSPPFSSSSLSPSSLSTRSSQCGLLFTAVSASVLLAAFGVGLASTGAGAGGAGAGEARAPPSCRTALVEVKALSVEHCLELIYHGDNGYRAVASLLATFVSEELKCHTLTVCVLAGLLQKRPRDLSHEEHLCALIGTSTIPGSGGSSGSSGGGGGGGRSESKGGGGGEALVGLTTEDHHRGLQGFVRLALETVTRHHEPELAATVLTQILLLTSRGSAVPVSLLLKGGREGREERGEEEEKTAEDEEGGPKQPPSSTCSCRARRSAVGGSLGGGLTRRRRRSHERGGGREEQQQGRKGAILAVIAEAVNLGLLDSEVVAAGSSLSSFETQHEWEAEGEEQRGLVSVHKLMGAAIERVWSRSPLDATFEDEAVWAGLATSLECEVRGLASSTVATPTKAPATTKEVGLGGSLNRLLPLVDALLGSPHYTGALTLSSCLTLRISFARLLRLVALCADEGSRLAAASEYVNHGLALLTPYITSGMNACTIVCCNGADGSSTAARESSGGRLGLSSDTSNTAESDTGALSSNTSNTSNTAESDTSHTADLNSSAMGSNDTSNTMADSDSSAMSCNTTSSADSNSSTMSCDTSSTAADTGTGTSSSRSSSSSSSSSESGAKACTTTRSTVESGSGSCCGRGGLAGGRRHSEQRGGLRRCGSSPHRMRAVKSEVGSLYLVLGSVDESMGRYQAASESRQQALSVRLELNGGSYADASVAESLSALADSLCLLGRYKESVAAHLQALEVRRTLYGTELHHEVASSVSQIGITLYTWGRFVEAESYSRKGLALRLAVWGTDYHRDVAFSLSNLCSILNAVGAYGEALECCLRLLQIQERLFGVGQHRQVAWTLGDVGIALFAVARYAEAVSYHRRALALKHTVFGEDEAHPSIAWSLFGLGKGLTKLGEREAALAYHRECLHMRKKIYKTERHSIVALSHTHTGRTLLTMGRVAEALDHMRQAEAILAVTYGDEPHAHLGILFDYISRALSASRNYGEAAEYARRSIAVLIVAYGKEGHANVALAFISLAGCLLGLRATSLLAEDAASLLAEDAASLLAEDAASLLAEDAVSLLAEDAQFLASWAVATLEAAYGTEAHDEVGCALDCLGQALSAQGRFEEAAQVYRRALSAFSTVLQGEESSPQQRPHSPSGAVAMAHVCEHLAAALAATQVGKAEEEPGNEEEVATLRARAAALWNDCGTSYLRVPLGCIIV